MTEHGPLRTMLTRWEQLYQADARVSSAPPSRCVVRALDRFVEVDAHTILDLGCGSGRDTQVLVGDGRFVVGVDAARSALRLAQERFDLTRGRAALAHADARRLPFPTACFDGVYCFGLLHEFTDSAAEADVRAVMYEIARVLRPQGILALAVLAGEPEQGLPHVRLFNESIFNAATRAFELIEKEQVIDIGCTGRDNYGVWFGVFRKPLVPADTDPNSQAL